MQWLHDWVQQIILFMFIGTLIEMLLPGNRFKKYVHLIVGLVFLLILAKPLFYVLQVDLSQQMEGVERHMSLDIDSLEEIKNHIERQKEDIQAEQVAYIWNELADQLVAVANEELDPSFNIQVIELWWEGIDEVKERRKDSVPSMTVLVKQGDKVQPFTNIEVEAIMIGKGEKNWITHQVKNEEAIIEQLRELWKIDEAVDIELWWEGEEGA